MQFVRIFVQSIIFTMILAMVVHFLVFPFTMFLSLHLQDLSRGSINLVASPDNFATSSDILSGLYVAVTGSFAPLINTLIRPLVILSGLYKHPPEFPCSHRRSCGELTALYHSPLVSQAESIPLIDHYRNLLPLKLLVCSRTPSLMY